jgi:hypothetical protein
MNQFSFQPYNPLTEGGKRHILNILRGSPVSDGSAGGMNQFDMPIETFKETYGVYPTTVEEGCKVYYLNGSIEAKVLIGEI